MQLITTNKQLTVGRHYWCRNSKYPHFEPDILKVGEISGRKYIGTGKIWAMDENNQALERFDIVGPIPTPNFDEQYMYYRDLP